MTKPIRESTRRREPLMARWVALGGWLALAAAIGGCGLGVEDAFAPLTATDNFHIVKDGTAYRSAQLDATSLALVLNNYGIRTVINLRGENAGEGWYDAERETCAALGVTLVDIAMSAHDLPPRAALLQLFDTFAAAEYPILIHCNAGADRTGAASAIWRMEVLGDSREEAAQELSPAYGHFAFATPEMDALVQMFVPDRNWILNDYPVP